MLTGDTDYIWKLGGLMLVITLVQVAFSIGAIFCGAKAAMASAATSGASCSTR